ncbi:MAG: P1 family peptidase [Chloroflexi bacterium]|nr:P1 family peptidase [Chloroflexota bacterium]
MVIETGCYSSTNNESPDTGRSDGAISGKITDVPGITVGHYTDIEHATGCTAILSEHAATGGIDVRGASPGSRETELLQPLASGELVNGYMLTGGSVWGLATADGATRFMTERKIGVQFAGKTVPLIPATVIFDLALKSDVCPGADAGYMACEAADADFEQGSVGAGTGATLGTLKGPRRRIKGGIGTASVRLDDDIVVGALIVVNAVGGVVDPDTGMIVAGPRDKRIGGGYVDSVDLLINDPPPNRQQGWDRNPHTVIGVVATNAAMDKKGASRLAGAGQDAIALAVRPAHTESDGDTVFALATGDYGPVHPDRLRAAATRAVVNAILSAVEQATGLGGIPSASEYLGGQ